MPTSLVTPCSLRQPRRIVTVSGRGVRGFFPSRKSAKPVQFESLIEEMTLRLLEVAPSVRSITTQPGVIEYLDGWQKRRYTPDVEIATDHGTSFIEVKDDLALSPHSEAAVRIRAAVRYLRQNSGRLHIVLRSDLIANDLQLHLAHLLRQRPLRNRYRPDIDCTLWDPESGTEPSAAVQQQWEEAKRECDELLGRIMGRNPDDLLPVPIR